MIFILFFCATNKVVFLSFQNNNDEEKTHFKVRSKYGNVELNLKALQSHTMLTIPIQWT
jgi:hypothetical protein